MTNSLETAGNPPVEEAPLDAARPIIDPHHHLWHMRPPPAAMKTPSRFLLEEFVGMVEASGHQITHSVFVECHSMYRAEGLPEYKPLGETEFVNGMAAMSASGKYGPCHVATRIVGSADFRLGDGVEPILEAHHAACGERFRGVRFTTAYSEAGQFGFPTNPSGRELMRQPSFHAVARVLKRMGFSLDVWCFHTQLEELIELADAIPELLIILDHIGTPEPLGRYAGRKDEARAEWSASMRRLAERPNVLVKLGGLGMDVSRPPGSFLSATSSEKLAAEWRPYLETCIEAFSPARCMFQSNFPADATAGSYGAIWNAFKIIARGHSDGDKDLLFRRTAAKAYQIPIGDGKGS